MSATIFLQEPWIDFAGRSDSFGKAEFPWTLPFAAACSPLLRGPLPLTQPMGTISWGIACAPAADLLAPWRQCLNLLTHI
ncbi:MAG: hypothetical protein P4L42_15420 [Desulfocapsaceae bacterium]|nr:hypothetical protein [Desulfocapsaceae bacterium]